MVRTFAQLISFIFHPLLIITYMLVLLMLVNPYLFGVNSIAALEARILILLVFASTFFIPAFAVMMMRLLGLSESIYLEKKEERIIPYIATGVFYLAMFRFLLYDTNVPIAFKSFVLGATIALFIAFFINLFSKISMHAVGMGGLLGMIVITMMMFSYNYFFIDIAMIGTQMISLNIVLMVVLLMTGIVCSARLILNAHSMQDLYGGLIVGFSSQFIAMKIFLSLLTN